MPDTQDLLGRQESALQGIAKALGVEVSSLRGNAPGQPQLERTMTLENIATAVSKAAKAKTSEAEVKSKA